MMNKGAYQLPAFGKGLWANGIVAYTYDTAAKFSNLRDDDYLIIFGDLICLKTKKPRLRN